MAFLRRAVLALSAPILVAGLSIVNAPLASASTYPYVYICNSVNSAGPAIRLVSANGLAVGQYVGPGSCKLYDNTNNNARVDPDPEEVNYNDVDSTWWGYQGQGLDYCDPGEGLIDPPNYYVGYIKYNTDRSGC